MRSVRSSISPSSLGYFIAGCVLTLLLSSVHPPPPSQPRGGGGAGRARPHLGLAAPPSPLPCIPSAELPPPPPPPPPSPAACPVAKPCHAAAPSPPAGGRKAYITSQEAAARLYTPEGMDPRSVLDLSPWRLAPATHEAQMLIWTNQHPDDCSTAKFIVSNGHWHSRGNGIGSIMHVTGCVTAARAPSPRVFRREIHVLPSPAPPTAHLPPRQHAPGRRRRAGPRLPL